MALTEIDHPSASDEALDAAVEALRSVTLAAQNLRLRMANFAGINVTDSMALTHLALADALTSGELAKRVGLAPSGATGLVDRLERAGLARRSTRPGDRRTIYITLTEHGAESLALSAQWIKLALLDLGENKIESVTETLSALAATLERRAGEFGATVGEPAKK